MYKIIVNIVFVVLIATVIFPVKELTGWLLKANTTASTTTKSDVNDDDTANDSCELVKKVDLKLKFDIQDFYTAEVLSAETLLTKYTDLAAPLPPNHAGDIHTPPPNC